MTHQTLLIIPHFRDTHRLAPFLEELMATLPSRFAILISDDGSGDAEVARLRSLVSSVRQNFGSAGPVLLDPLLHQPNTGKGAAVFRGWDQGAGYSRLAFADADGAVCAAEILRAENYLRSDSGGHDALFGSRVKMLGRTIDRRLHRHLSGRVFATLVSMASGLDSYDTQCGLKILTHAAFTKIRPHVRCAGFAFDVELCLLLQKAGQSIIEFPVDWHDVADGKVSLLKDSFGMAREVFEICRRVSEIRF